MKKLAFQNINVSEIRESKTNPRGKDFAGPAFNDLVASIKEKGVFVPVIVRKIGKEYEIVAGSRRLKAAQQLKLKEIPANVQELSDTEAREVQIIENLQREDVHPIDEGDAYRALAEKGKLELEAIAAKVGKSLVYVKRRLILTDLTAESKVAYRSGKINAGQAEIVSRMEPGEQKKLLIFIERRDPDMDDLREEVQRLRIGKLITTPPWKGHEQLVAAMAPCDQCSKKKGGDLFGEGAAEQCGDPTCFARRLAAHIAIVKQEMREKKIPLTLISSHWRSEVKGALNRDDYRIANPHAVHADKCKSAHKALVVDGDEDLGKVIEICTDKKCEVHGEHRSSIYRQTPAEKATRKRQLQAAKAKVVRQTRELETALKKVQWPFTEKNLDALLQLAFDNAGSNNNRVIAKRHGLEVQKKKTSWGTPTYDYAGALKSAAKKMTKAQKAQLAFELLIDTGYGSFHAGMKLL